jgi:hypothetical protein
VDRIFDVQSDGPDRVLFGLPMRWSIGYALPQPVTAPAVPDGRVCSQGRSRALGTALGSTPSTTRLEIEPSRSTLIVTTSPG